VSAVNLQQNRHKQSTASRRLNRVATQGVETFGNFRRSRIVWINTGLIQMLFVTMNETRNWRSASLCVILCYIVSCYTGLYEMQVQMICAGHTAIGLDFWPYRLSMAWVSCHPM